MEHQGAFQPLAAKKKFCGECGAPNELDYAFCEACGAPLAELKEAAGKKTGGTKKVQPELVPTDAFATGLASWDLVPPQVVVRRRRRGM